MSDIYALYSGFTIDRALGNNAFSFESRKNKSIHVAPLIRGTLQDLAVSSHYAFSEVVDNTEYYFFGLKNFIHWKYKKAECFIFDNHNHAFFFWTYALNKGLFNYGATLVHVDQHTDLRRPENMISREQLSDLKNVFRYTNEGLNVGNFIQPALLSGIFSKADIIDSSTSFKKSYNKAIILDLDMDIFSEDMQYIKGDLKISKIREYADKADFITIATSPFFMDQNEAIKRLREIFS